MGIGSNVRYKNCHDCNKYCLLSGYICRDCRKRRNNIIRNQKRRKKK